MAWQHTGTTATEAEQLETALQAAGRDPDSRYSWPIWSVWEIRGLKAALAALSHNNEE